MNSLYPARHFQSRVRDRSFAVAEVVLVFALTHLAYRTLKYFTPIGKWDVETNFTPGVVMIIVAILLLVLRKGKFADYGLSVKGWQRQLSLGLVCSVVLIGIWAIGLAVTGIRFDSARPPDPHAPDRFQRIAMLAVIAVPACVLILIAIRSRGQVMERIPPAVSIPAVLGLLSVLPVLSAYHRHHAEWGQALWLFLGAGFGEEIFFRGHIQSRLDQVFGCPFYLLGCRFGVGLLISALLFGFIHVLNTVDYFHGRFDFGWAYGIEAFWEGVLFGAIRAKSGSVLPGAVTHGLLDAFARVPKIVLGA